MCSSLLCLDGFNGLRIAALGDVYKRQEHRTTMSLSVLAASSSVSQITLRLAILLAIDGLLMGSEIGDDLEMCIRDRR